MSAHLQRASLLYEQRRYDLAEQELRQALANAPNNALAHALLGLCLAHAERFPDATQEAETAIHLAPDFPFAHYALASVLHDRQRLDEATAAIDEAIRLDPEDADLFALLSQIRLDQRRWGEALAAADAGLRLDPEHTDCTNLRAAALVRLGRRQEAGATIEGALARAPEDATTHANQGWACLHQGDQGRALEHFREALRLNPQLDWARQGLVEALKARNPVYGLLLRYFLWMSRLSGRAQWGVIIGGFLGYRLLLQVARANPSLAPWITPLLIVYGLFVILTWLADPLFTLLLRLNRFGRLVLTREEVAASNWVGGSLLVALVLLAAGLAMRQTTILLAALVCGALVLPLAGAFKCAPGWPRQVMAGLTALLAAVGLAGLGLSVAGLSGAPGGPGAGEALLGLALLGAFLSGWVANALAMVRPKR